MNEGRSEAFQPASDEIDQECTDVQFYHKDPSKFVTVHHNCVKIWQFDSSACKLKYINCPLGHIKRWITCVNIDTIDEHAYCGTRSGDVLEISLSKGIYNRSGPINKKIQGSVNHVISKGKSIYIGTNSGIFGKIDKASLNITGEVQVPHSSINGLAKSENKIYTYSDRGVVRSVMDKESPQ